MGYSITASTKQKKKKKNLTTKEIIDMGNNTTIFYKGYQKAYGENVFTGDDLEREEDVDLINRINKLDLQKGDVLLITVDDSNPKNLPRKLLSKLIKNQCEAIRDAFEKTFNNKIQIIFIPKSMDVSVIRLEEWFV